MVQLSVAQAKSRYPNMMRVKTLYTIIGYVVAVIIIVGIIHLVINKQPQIIYEYVTQPADNATTAAADASNGTASGAAGQFNQTSGDGAFNETAAQINDTAADLEEELEADPFMDGDGDGLLLIIGPEEILPINDTEEQNATASNTTGTNRTAAMAANGSAAANATTTANDDASIFEPVLDDQFPSILQDMFEQSNRLMQEIIDSELDQPVVPFPPSANNNTTNSTTTTTTQINKNPNVTSPIPQQLANNTAKNDTIFNVSKTTVANTTE